MIDDIRYYRDQTHQPRVQAIPEHSSLAEYLESDLQDTETSAEILKILDKKNFGGEQEINGNSYTVILAPELITLENMFDEEEKPYQLPVEMYQKLVASWADFLASEGLLSIVPKL
jgi:hypothetical protein